jgi:hypothetical protein
MGWFWFLVSIGLLIALVTRRQSATEDTYAQGYWDGYRAFGTKLQERIRAKRTNAAALQELIDEGQGAKSAERLTPEEVFMEDTYGSARADAGGTTDRIDWSYPVETVPESTPVYETAELTPEQQAARSLRNLNIILYVASFLLVAAGALFVSSSSSSLVKLLGVACIIALFYGVGFGVYLKSQRLRPAALAFLGTGMALIPFAGFALQQYTNLTAGQSWAITSLVGLIAYYAVAIRLRSQLVSYLTMAFVLSLAGSMTALGTKLVIWQFVTLIVVSLVASLLARLAPKWIPQVFSEPIERTGQIVTPVALVASLFLFDTLRLIDYEVLFALATVHYVVAWLQTRDIVYETSVRLLSYVVLTIMAWDIFNANAAVAAFTMALLLTFQHAYSLLVVRRPGRLVREQTWIALVMVAQVLLCTVWAGSTQAALFNTIILAVIGATSALAAWQLRWTLMAYVGLTASIILPFIVARDLFATSLPWWTLTVWFGAVAVQALSLYRQFRHRATRLRVFLTISYISYGALVLMTSWMDGGSIVMAAASLGLAVFALAASYIARAPYAELATPALLLLGTVALSDVLNVTSVWRPVFVGGVTATALWVLTMMHGYFKQTARQALALTSAQLALLISMAVILGLDAAANKVVFVIMLTAAFASLALRWRYESRALLRAIFTCSYPVYFAVALVIGVMINTDWTMIATGLGVLLFLLSSYIERQPYMQIVSVILTVLTMGFIASRIAMPAEWYALFTFGGSALLFFAATGLHAAYKQSLRQLIMASAGQTALFLIIFGANFAQYGVTLTTFIILVVWAVLSLALRWWCRDRSPGFATLFAVSYLVYYVGSLLLLGMLAPIWSVLGFTLGAVIFWVASYAERAPWVVILGNIFMAIAMFRFWLWAEFDSDWLLLGVTWILAVIFYFGYWALAGLQDTWRSRALLWSTWAILGFAAFAHFVSGMLPLATGATIVALAVTLGVEGWRTQRRGLVESSVYVATFGLQRIVELVVPEINFVAFAHWWALTIAVIGLMSSTYRRTRFVVAMSFITLSSGIFALSEGSYYQPLFLVEHLALLVTGALRSKSWAIWWGISASTVAILYFLREYTFLWLGFLGLLMIAIVVWRLLRSGSAHSRQ